MPYSAGAKDVVVSSSPNYITNIPTIVERAADDDAEFDSDKSGSDDDDKPVRGSSDSSAAAVPRIVSDTLRGDSGPSLQPVRVPLPVKLSRSTSMVPAVRYTAVSKALSGRKSELVSVRDLRFEQRVTRAASWRTNAVYSMQLRRVIVHCPSSVSLHLAVHRL
jgi:hypothetical protein